MFNKNDPLINSVNQVMKENQIIRDVEKAINEEFGIASKRDLPFQVHAEYDALVEEMKQEALVGNQHRLDVNNNNRLDGPDFEMLRGMKKKPESVQERAGIAGSATGLSGASGSTSTAGSGTGSANAAPTTGPTIRKTVAPTGRNTNPSFGRGAMEEQQVNTAVKSNKMTSAPAKITTLKPLNVPGLPKLGGMTVAQKGAMKEESLNVDEGLEPLSREHKRIINKNIRDRLGTFGEISFSKEKVPSGELRHHATLTDGKEKFKHSIRIRDGQPHVTLREQVDEESLDEVLDTPAKAFKYGAKNIFSKLTGNKNTVRKRGRGEKFFNKKVKNINAKREMDAYHNELAGKVLRDMGQKTGYGAIYDKMFKKESLDEDQMANLSSGKRAKLQKEERIKNLANVIKNLRAKKMEEEALDEFIAMPSTAPTPAQKFNQSKVDAAGTAIKKYTDTIQDPAKKAATQTFVGGAQKAAEPVLANQGLKPASTSTAPTPAQNFNQSKIDAAGAATQKFISQMPANKRPDAQANLNKATQMATPILKKQGLSPAASAQKPVPASVIGGDASKNAAVARMQSQRQSVRTGSDAAMAPKTYAQAPKPPASGGGTNKTKKPAAPAVPKGMYMVRANFKDGSGLRPISNIGGGGQGGKKN